MVVKPTVDDNSGDILPSEYEVSMILLFFHSPYTVYLFIWVFILLEVLTYLLARQCDC